MFDKCFFHLLFSADDARWVGSDHGIWMLRVTTSLSTVASRDVMCVISDVCVWGGRESNHYIKFISSYVFLSYFKYDARRLLKGEKGSDLWLIVVEGSSPSPPQHSHHPTRPIVVVSILPYFHPCPLVLLVALLLPCHNHPYTTTT